jgi:hypothetical protein
MVAVKSNKARETRFAISSSSDYDKLQTDDVVQPVSPGKSS